MLGPGGRRCLTSLNETVKESLKGFQETAYEGSKEIEENRIETRRDTDPCYVMVESLAKL